MSAPDNDGSVKTKVAACPWKLLPFFYFTSKCLIMTNLISKMAEKGQEDRSPLFKKNSGQIFWNWHTAYFPPFLFPLDTAHILKLPMSEGICASRVARMPKVNRGAVRSNPMSGRKMDSIGLVWPRTFINNAMPITLETSLDSCWMRNFIPGLWEQHI